MRPEGLLLAGRCLHRAFGIISPGNAFQQEDGQKRPLVKLYFRQLSGLCRQVCYNFVKIICHTRFR
jgi:hypothetical protein